MKRTIKYLEAVKEEIEDEWDHVAVVLGKEGVGKSTFMFQTAWFWRDLWNRDQQDIMEVYAWSLDDFKHQMANKSPGEMIVVNDMARLMHKKKSMSSETVELENDFYDVRGQRLFYMLGYQRWESAHTMLADHRIDVVFKIPMRGRVHGYGRKQIDKKLDGKKWPEPVFTDSFEQLEGVPLWNEFKKKDLEEKQSRIDVDQKEIDAKEVAKQIREGDISKVIGEDGRTGEPKIDKELIEVEYDLSKRDASKVWKLLKRDVDLDTLLPTT